MISFKESIYTLSLFRSLSINQITAPNTTITNTAISPNIVQKTGNISIVYYFYVIKFKLKK